MMSLQELHAIIRTIQGLPDDFLIRILMAATQELLRRTQEQLRDLKDLTKKQ
ncbi:hypothetical protein ES702_04563 [subsurface metagenome]